MALINCPECGKKVSDKSKACIHCGYPFEEKEKDIFLEKEENIGDNSLEKEEKSMDNHLEEKVTDDFSEEKNVDDLVLEEKATVDETVNEVVTQKSHKKRNVILVGMGVLVVFVLAFVTFGGKGFVGSQKTLEQRSIYARCSEEGKAYIPTMDGETIVIDGEVKKAILTADRMHVIVCTQDGCLYISDSAVATKKVIADNCDTFLNVSNDGFIYTDKTGNMYRVLFEDNTVVELEELDSYDIASNSTSILYTTEEGEIFSLSNTSTESVKLGSSNSSSEEIHLHAISDNAKMAVWSVEDGYDRKILMSYGDDKITLGEISSKYNSWSVVFSKDQNMAVVYHTDGESIWLLKADEEPIEVQLGAVVSSYQAIYTKDGYFSDQISSDIDSFYMYCQGEEGYNVYNISINGEREKILSNIQDFRIVDGYIIYRDMDESLYYAELVNGEDFNSEKIASDVDVYDTSSSIKYVYYMKDCEDNKGSLYVHKIGTDDPVKIDTDVSCYSNSWSRLKFNNKGNKVYYYKDLEEIEGTYSEHGTLRSWSYGDDESIRIASEVIISSLDSGYKEDCVEESGFVYMKYKSADGHDIRVDWVYYDGKESVKLASDVSYLY